MSRRLALGMKGDVLGERVWMHLGAFVRALR